MIFWNYYLCVTTPPGSVPPGWVRVDVPFASRRDSCSETLEALHPSGLQTPDPATQQAFEVKRVNHGPRFCKSCEHYKPPRAHHCRQCKGCVVSQPDPHPLAVSVNLYNALHPRRARNPAQDGSPLSMDRQLWVLAAASFTKRISR
jgi:palmitoyltransferase